MSLAASQTEASVAAPIDNIKGRHCCLLAQRIIKAMTLAETANLFLQPGMGHCAQIDPVLHASHFCPTLRNRLLIAETECETSYFILWKLAPVHLHFLYI
jgi:hypothetical protein